METLILYVKLINVPRKRRIIATIRSSSPPELLFNLIHSTICKMSEVRQRKTPGEGPVSSAGGREEAINRSGFSISILDIARSIVFLFLASGLTSWLVTGKDFWWGHRPAFTRADVVKAWIVSSLILRICGGMMCGEDSYADRK